MVRRPALLAAEVLALLLVLKAPQTLNVAFDAMGWVLKSPAGVWVIVAGLVVVLAWSVATYLRRAIYVSQRLA